MSIRVTITKPNVTDAYGLPMVVGSTYTVNDDFGLSLISQGMASDTDASLTNPGVREADALGVLYCNAATLAAPTAQMLASYNTVFALDVAPFTRYRSNGTYLVPEGQYSTDASGNITGLAGAGGRAALLRQFKLTNEIGMKPAGVTINHNAGAGNTWCMKMAAPGDFTAVRVVYYHGSTSGTTVVKAAVAATETALQDTDVNRWRPVVGGTEYSTLDATEQYGWKSVTWAAASSITPAAGTATAPTVVVSDWIPLRSVPRSDGSAFPLCHVRVNFTGGTSSYTGTDASMNTATAANGGFIFQCGWGADASGLYVTAPAANNPSGAQNRNMPAIGLQFRTRKPGIAIIGVGDSLTQCGAVVADNFSSWGWRAAAAISALGIPCGFVNNGVASQDASVFEVAGENAISKWGCNVVTYQSFSPNGPGTPPFSTDATMRYAIQQQAALMEKMIAYSKSAGAIPIIASPLPGGNITNASQDAYRLSYNTEVLTFASDRVAMNWNTLFTDGASPARINSTYLYTTDGLGVHVNEAGVAVQATLLQTALATFAGC